jgi:hypothetical protein
MFMSLSPNWSLTVIFAAPRRRPGWPLPQVTVMTIRFAEKVQQENRVKTVI